jgi:mannose-6-phosphate isomerase-like protein (cupin superfamily)
MPDWIKKNFQRLRDKSPRDAPMQWKMARDALRSPELGVSRFTYEPGARMPFGHRHREQEEIYVVVAGSGHAKLDDELIDLETWDVLRVAPAIVRSFAGRPGRPGSHLHRRPQAQRWRHRARARLLGLTAAPRARRALAGLEVAASGYRLAFVHGPTSAS